MNQLKDLAIKFKTDKIFNHNYIETYNNYMSQNRLKNVSLFEIGIGGYDNENKGGNSLRLWKNFFPFGKIFAIDIYNKKFIQEKRIKVFQGSQIDKVFLDNIFSRIGKVDYIIDDGSHLSKHVIQTFEYLFKYLKNGGYYFIEDTQTSYWPRYGGNSFNFDNKKSAINFFKKIIDKINYMEFDNPFFRPDFFAKHITQIHFYHNMIVIKKDINNEKSNVIVNKMLPFKKKIFFNFNILGRYFKYCFYFSKNLYNKFLDFLKI